MHRRRSRVPVANLEVKLSFMGHIEIENRYGLAAAGVLSKATGTAERRSSEAMLDFCRQESSIR